MKPRQASRLQPREGFYDRRKSDAFVPDLGWRDDVMEIKYRQMSGKNECEYGIFHDTSLKRHMRFFPKRKRHNRSTTGDMPTGTETDDDSLMGILGGPYQPPNKEDPAIIHLKYSIPRNNDGVNPVTGNQKQVLNPFNRSGLMREKERGSCVCTSRCRVSECNFKQIFRRKKDHPSRGRQLESNITSTQPTNEGPKSAGIFWKLGRKIEWPTRRTIRNTFRIPRIRQTTRPTDDSYDVWSDVSSLGASSYSASETIVFEDRTTGIEGDSFFTDFIHALDDIANLRFLDDEFQCGVYESSRPNVAHETNNLSYW